MDPTKNFENLTFNPFITDDNNQDEIDPDLNFYNDLNRENYETEYLYENEIPVYLKDLKKYENLSLIHLNIRSIQANFESFKQLLEESNFAFNVICLSETWSSDKAFSENSNYQIPNYNSIHLERKICKKGGGVLIYIRNNLLYKIRNDLSVSDCDSEVLSVEIINKNKKNFIISNCYRPPNGNSGCFNTFLQNIFNTSSSEKKGLFVIGDFNLNALKYEESSLIKEFYDNLFQYGIVPLINKPTRVTSNSATLIDNIFTNVFFETSLKKGILKSSISDHFPIFAAVNISNSIDIKKSIEITKRNYSDLNKGMFKEELEQFDWSILATTDDVNLLYNTFLENFMKIYNKHFPIEKKKVKIKDITTPWFSKGMKKSSKQKQKLYIKYLKKKTDKTKMQYKNYKNLFEKLKRKAKQHHYTKLISKYKNDSKKTWQVLKEITGKMKLNRNNFPKMIKAINKNLHNEKEIAREFNHFFTTIGPKLAAKIPKVKKSFKNYLTPVDTEIENNELTFGEFEKAFKSLQRNKAAGIDDINSNVVLDNFNGLQKPLFKIFKKSVEKGVFPDKLKIAKVTPIFKAGDSTESSNYRPISVLPIFSKILEKIMYNRIYSYIDKNNLLYSRQFGFQKKTSTEHAILQLVEDITKSFSEGKYTLGVFIDLSKAFDTVNHEILNSKLSYYGIKGLTKKWLTNYLTNRSQCVNSGNGFLSDPFSISCGVPQGSIL